MNLRLNRSRGNRALGIIALLIFVAAVLVIGGTIVYILIKICKRCLPPPGNGGGTNTVTEVNWESPDWSPEQPMVLPNFQFPELPAIAGGTEENPLGAGWIELERSTNLTDWVTILVTNGNYQFCFCDDTNESPMAFYRMKLVIP